MAKNKLPPVRQDDALVSELHGLIDAARQHVAQTDYATLTMLYWPVGQRIRREVLKKERAEYGELILATLSQELVRDYTRSQ